MDVEQHWKMIKKTVNQANRSNRFCAVATVNPDGSPRISPIGSLILGEAGKGLYFEKFPRNMRENLHRDPRLCVLAVCGGFWFWFKSLYRGRFEVHPGLRLMGRAGGRRSATQEEVTKWQNRVRPFRRFKGHELLWKDMRHVRDVTFDAAEPLHLGPMGRGLWGSHER